MQFMRFGTLATSLTVTMIGTACGTHNRLRQPYPASWAAAFPGADSLRVEQVAAGVQHVYAWQPAGPWAIHALVIDRAQCGPQIAVRHAGPPLTASAGVTDIAGRSSHALAAMNADFFALPAGTPVGAQVTAGDVIAGPGRRPVFAITDSGYWIGVAAVRGTARAAGGDVARISQVNRPRAGDAAHPPAGGLTMFTSWLGRPTTVDSAAVTLGIRVVGSGRGVVTATTRTAGVPLGPGRIALQGAAGTDSTGAWLSRRAIGDTVVWHADVVPAFGIGPAAHDVVGGFPHLLRAGVPVTDAGEVVRADFGPARHPRSAIGWVGNGERLVWVVVDGRQAPYSDGMSLAELTTLFQHMGVTDAINLDGGGSTTMVIKGRIVNRTSDRNGERAVGNALVLEGCTAR